MTNTACVAISRETLPMLISVHDAMRIGITRNRFYALSHRDNNMVVTIGDRVFLHRDNLLAWLAQGGDRSRKDKD